MLKTLEISIVMRAGSSVWQSTRLLNFTKFNHVADRCSAASGAGHDDETFRSFDT